MTAARKKTQKQKRLKKTFPFLRSSISSFALFFSLFFIAFGSTSAQSFQDSQISDVTAPPEPIVQDAADKAPEADSPSLPSKPLPDSVNGGTFPYTDTFGITAYYSPLPGQNRYATGNYESEKRLQGNGIHGASGKPVFPGMVAAPSKYAFGTKMYIPGIGTVGVYDRGGAIVAAGQRGMAHDRIDIWMGYGDKGLERALRWGFRTVPVTVYGIDPSIQEKVYLEGYSETERVVQNVLVQPKLFPQDVWYLSQGEDVFRLQRVLQSLGYLNQAPNGFYGDETRDAVFKFQQDQNLVESMNDIGAGHTGPSTRIKLEMLFEKKKSENIPGDGLSKGEGGDGVKKLQALLKSLGYDLSLTGLFDDQTLQALIQFQKDKGLVADEKSYGAGIFGPRTKQKIEDAYMASITKSQKDPTVDVPEYMVRDLKLGDSGPAVTELQRQLQVLNYLRIEPTGYYGPVTEHAVFKFQQAMNLAGDMESKGAGIFGPVTRSKINTLVASSHYTEKLIASKSAETTAVLAQAFVVPEGLSYGSRGSDVEKLQSFLKKAGYLAEITSAGTFDDATKDALVTFQKSNQLIESEFDTGAGRVGPKTKSLIEKYFATLG